MITRGERVSFPGLAFPAKAAARVADPAGFDPDPPNPDLEKILESNVKKIQELLSKNNLDPDPT